MYDVPHTRVIQKGCVEGDARKKIYYFKHQFKVNIRSVKQSLTKDFSDTWMKVMSLVHVKDTNLK